MTAWDRILVSIAIDAAKNCIEVFEKEYPNDRRPRKTLEMAEQWFKEPTWENLQLLEKLEITLWRSAHWECNSAALAAQACALAARAAHHPLTSAMHAIECERCANGFEHRDYARNWLRKVPGRVGPDLGVKVPARVR
ncbi:MAG TPA: hypothetical protein VJP02_22685 [Candidatus Sulfotelmatobacter sp.]|nr:hypothetical protein [Candidatus Sulfotelmatobacter sp.]